MMRMWCKLVRWVEVEEGEEEFAPERKRRSWMITIITIATIAFIAADGDGRCVTSLLAGCDGRIWCGGDGGS
jgi:hypothetical protein